MLGCGFLGGPSPGESGPGHCIEDMGGGGFAGIRIKTPPFWWSETTKKGVREWILGLCVGEGKCERERESDDLFNCFWLCAVPCLRPRLGPSRWDFFGGLLWLLLLLCPLSIFCLVFT